jgi:hypothetical protein
MKKVSFVAGRLFQGNLIFDKKQTRLVVGSFDKFHRLHDDFKRLGYDLATAEINKPAESDIVLYLDMPKELPHEKDINKSYLLANESSIIKPENFDIHKHRYFTKVFTWNDIFIDYIKYIKLNYSFKLPDEIYKETKRKCLCCLIVSNKSSSRRNELYSERKNLIRWFEKNHPADFHLYGIGWDRYRFEGKKIFRALNRIPLLNRIIYKLFAKKYSSYMGKVDSKFETMRNYKFAIAYENVKDELGYITEKMFDVFIAGCVPVYWGAKNITDYVPDNCFIDRRKFKTNKELYEYLKEMPDNEYIQYLDNIEMYLNSEQAQQFSAENFSRTLIENCVSEN